MESRVDPMTDPDPLGFRIEDLQRVRLGVRSGHAPSAKPPVRIFVGTEPAQYRPERVLVWSIEQVRDPARVYEITLLRELPGFDRSGWTTSFTNYRFLIPHLAGVTGRAIYNDEDQIYLSDPAELFDIDMEERGYLAISPEDTSVMLLDCERMAPVWPVKAIFSQTKNQLLARGRRVSGLWGKMGGEWNARDEEHREGWTRCLHYTTLHTQPWRPFPERFIYYDHPDADLWFSLERSANQAGFQLSTREEPSPGYARILAEQRNESSPAPKPETGSGLPEEVDGELRRLVSRAGATSLLEVVPGSSGGLGESEPRWGSGELRRIGLAKLVEDSSDLRRADGVLCLDGLDEVPAEDLPWVIDELARHARLFIFARVHEAPPRPAGGRRDPPSGDVGKAAWWQVFFEHAVARRPELHWTVAFEGASNSVATPLFFRMGGTFLGDKLPQVWVLAGDSREDTERALQLAEALGWPVECKTLEQAIQFVPPWPDLLISSDAAGAKASREMRERAGGLMRTVHLGAEGADPMDCLDLSVVPAFARLQKHPRRIETAALLPRFNESAREDAATRWKERLEETLSPRLGVLLGDDVTREPPSLEEAERLGRGTRVVAEARGMSVLFLGGPLVSDAVFRAFEEGLGRSAFRMPAPETSGDSLPATLGLADVLVVGSDSAAYLSEACATGKPVFIHRVEGSGGSWSAAVSDAISETVVRRAEVRPQNRRGTTRPQQWLEHFCAQLLAQGRIRPVPDLSLLRQALIERGLAQDLGMNFPDKTAPMLDTDLVLERIRSLVGVA